MTSISPAAVLSAPGLHWGMPDEEGHLESYGFERWNICVNVPMTARD